MAKKSRKTAAASFEAPPPEGWGPYGYGPYYGYSPYVAAGVPAAGDAAAWPQGAYSQMPYPQGAYPQGFVPPPWPGAPGAAMPHGAGMLGWLSNRQMEQFVMGLLLGGAAAYVLGDADKRAKLMRMVMKLYANVAGSVEEFKEQIADLKAEVAAEQGGFEE